MSLSLSLSLSLMTFYKARDRANPYILLICNYFISLSLSFFAKIPMIHI